MIQNRRCEEVGSCTGESSQQVLCPVGTPELCQLLVKQGDWRALTTWCCQKTQQAPSRAGQEIDMLRKGGIQ
jgi:hypothetical protein